MINRLLAVLGAAGVGSLCIAVAPADAQTPRNCAVELVSASRLAQQSLGPGRLHQFASGNVRARCINQSTTVRTDSFAHYPEFSRADFSGSVRFRDSLVSLDADRATYFLRDERLEAFGQVRLVNTATGSVLTGRRLTYLRAITGVRDTAEMYAVNRPRVEYRVLGDSVDPYVIIGNRVRLMGNSAAAVAGTVTIDRADFTARGDSAALDLDAGRGVLIGSAQVRSRDSSGYVLQGQSIAFRLTGGDLTWVQAREGADATGETWQLVGDTIEFRLADGEIQQGFSWGDSTRALSETQTIVADSLAMDLPGQVLSEVRGFGKARATSNTDSAAVEADWLAGDTLVVRFIDGEDGGRVLSLIQALGNAQAYYRIYDALQPSLSPGLNYSRGTLITARFREQELERVDVVGQADGVYLAPLRRRP